MQRFMESPRISCPAALWECKYTIRDRAKPTREEGGGEAKDNNVFNEEWHYSCGRPSRCELHWRLKLVRDGEKSKERKKKGKSKGSRNGDLGLSEVLGFAY